MLQPSMPSPQPAPAESEAELATDAATAGVLLDATSTPSLQMRDLLTQRYRTTLLRYFTKRLADASEADDLTQEVFERLVKQPATLEVRHAEGFLFQVAANVLRDKFRRDAVRHRSQHDELQDDTPAGEAPSAETLYQDRERLRLLVVALEELTPKCRAVFLLHRYDGLGYSEIARRMGVGVSAIEKHMMHAIKHLHQRLEID
jgi:RNA polymerase sigma factor (sigma-70 family)